MGLFLVVELECSSLLAWAVVATCSRCSIFLMLHNTRTRYTLHKLLCDSVPELVVTSLYVHDGVNIFQILHGSPGHLWEHKHSVCFTQIWRPDPPPPSPHRTRSLETRARGTEWFYCKEDLNIEGNFTIFFLNTTQFCPPLHCDGIPQILLTPLSKDNVGCMSLEMRSDRKRGKARFVWTIFRWPV